jgi:hypothetical protein
MEYFPVEFESILRLLLFPVNLNLPFHFHFHHGPPFELEFDILYFNDLWLAFGLPPSTFQVHNLNFVKGTLVNFTDVPVNKTSEFSLILKSPGSYAFQSSFKALIASKYEYKFKMSMFFLDQYFMFFPMVRLFLV